MDSPRSDAARWFAEEVQAHEPDLRGYMRGAFPTVRDVDDVVQESYLRIWRARAAEPIASARAFLFTVARRLALDQLRREKASPLITVADSAQLDVSAEQPSTVAVVEAREKIAFVAEALLDLPPRCREAVMLSKLRGLSRAEVARRLGIAEKTVDEQVARGVKKLEQSLRARGFASHYEP